MRTIPRQPMMAMMIVAVMLAFAPAYHAFCVTVVAADAPAAHVMADGSVMVMPTAPIETDSPATVEHGATADPSALLGLILLVVGVATAVIVGVKFCATRSRLAVADVVTRLRMPRSPPRSSHRAHPVDLTALCILRT